MDLIHQAEESVPLDPSTLPTNLHDLLVELLASGARFGYCGVRVAKPGHLPREGDLVIGFYATTPVTMSLAVGNVTWECQLGPGQFTPALKNYVAYPMCALYYYDLTITKISGEVIVIYCAFADMDERRRLTLLPTMEICPGIRIGCGTISRLD